MAKAYFCQEWIVSVKSGRYYKEVVIRAGNLSVNYGVNV